MLDSDIFIKTIQAMRFLEGLAAGFPWMTPMTFLFTHLSNYNQSGIMTHVLTLIFSSLSKNPASSVDQPASFEVRTLIAIDWSDIVSVDPWSFVWLLWLGRVKNALRNRIMFDPARRLNGLELVTKAILCTSLLLSALIFFLMRAWSSRHRKAHSPSQSWRGRWVDCPGSGLTCVSKDDERHILKSYYLLGGFHLHNKYLVLVDGKEGKLATFLKEFIFWNMGKVTVLTVLK